ncbi:acyl-CoA dehydrogenase family protein [Variovorax sp. RHLX14]|uniref:acyl-CoA dehydrogenase family protein n=1 Tax=Variovorax sp. RHLX14 TaxID=1259731 RepID=UPI003F48E9FA
MNDTTNQLTDALRDLLNDHCTLRHVRDIESGRSARPLWDALESSGFADALLPESHGGAGLSLADAFSLVELCGSFALPVPLAETMIARAFLCAADVQPPKGSIALGRLLPQDDRNAVCERVACGRTADWVLAAQADGCVLLPTAAATKTDAVFVLDATLGWNAAARAEALSLPVAFNVRLFQACLAAAQLSGTLMAVFDRTLRYANDRNQFGRPIGKFQAIQHQLAVISEHVFAARMAAQIGCRAVGWEPEPMRVAVAKSRTGEAALEVASLSHSIHGAIGFTEEFDLQIFTRRLHALRQVGGSESYWHDVLGSALLDARDSLALDVIRTVTDIA